MTKKAEKQPAAPPVVSEEDRRFEAEIVQRNPGRRISRFDFPRGIDEAIAIYMFELKAKDELLAAEMADANMTDRERKSVARAIEAEQRESIRLSVVGLVQVDARGAIQRRHIDQAQPLMELDDWSSKSWAALRTFFGELNGIPTEELGNAARGARKLTAATALPEQPTRAVAASSSGG
jgi:hypothetical protein